MTTDTGLPALQRRLTTGQLSMILLTTPFTGPFRTTLLYGVPFMALLVLAHRWQRRGTQPPG